MKGECSGIVTSWAGGSGGSMCSECPTWGAAFAGDCGESPLPLLEKRAHLALETIAGHWSCPWARQASWLAENCASNT